MTDARAVLARLEQAGVRVESRPDGALVLTPRNRLTDELREAARRAKPGIVATLKANGVDLSRTPRATFISIAAEDGAVPDIIERGTHGPRRTVRAGYQRFTWAAICAEVAKLRVVLRQPAEVVTLPLAVGVAGGGDGPVAGESARPALGLVESTSELQVALQPRASPRRSSRKRKPPAAPCCRGPIASRGRPSIRVRDEDELTKSERRAERLSPGALCDFAGLREGV